MKKNVKKILIPVAVAVTVLSAGAAFTSFAASGWKEENGSWAYVNSNGSKAKNQMQKSGDKWYYLGDDGYIVKSKLVEYDDNYYYFNGAGIMSTSQWREIDDSDGGDDGPGEWWYYFQENGKAVKRSGSSNSVKFVTLPTSTGSAKFTFDEEGRMQYGWIGEDGERLTEDDAWKNGVYYCQDNGNGRLVTSAWKYLETEDEEDKPDKEGDGNWFYFNPSGKKVKDVESKTINGKKYRFDENGAAFFEWYNNLATPGDASPSAGHKYYRKEQECWLATGWFKTVPGEEVDSEAYDNGDEYWFYAKSNGQLTTSQLKTIDGYKYGFDENGEMLLGLYQIEYGGGGNKIVSAKKIETINDIPDDEDENIEVYYFGTSPKDGVMQTGVCKIEVDGEKYNYNFRKSGAKKGAGVDGIDKDSIYIKGRRLEAEAGSKYEAIEYKGKNYLVSTSGKVMKNKKNVKDADDTYYCTDKNGIITYQGTDKKK